VFLCDSPSVILHHSFAVHHYFEKTCVILVDGNLDPIIRLIGYWGVAAPLISLLLVVIQEIVAPHASILGGCG
jgi:hypothetical protein